jgi:hypothetical protein
LLAPGTPARLAREAAHAQGAPTNAFFVLSNAAALASALNASTLQLHDTTEAAMVDTRAVSLWLLVAAMAIVFALALAVAGVYLQSEHMKAAVWALFLLVPRTVVRVLRGAAERKLLSLESNLDADDSGSGEDDLKGSDTEDVVELIDWDHIRFVSPRSMQRVRKYRRSYVANWTNVLKLAGPLLAVVAYFGLLIVWHDTAHSGMLTRSESLQMAQWRVTSTLHVDLHVTRALFHPNASLAAESARAAIAAGDDALFINLALLYGYEPMGVRGVLKSDPAQAALFIEDACGVADVAGASASECASFYNGLLTNGLLSALQEYVALSRTIAADVAMGLAPPAHANDAFHQLRTLHMRFLVPGLEYAARLHLDDMTTFADRYVALHLTATILFVLGLLVLYLFLIRPQVFALSREQMRTWMMLLLLPDAVVRRVPVIRNRILQFVGLAGGSRGSASPRDDARKGAASASTAASAKVAKGARSRGDSKGPSLGDSEVDSDA